MSIRCGARLLLLLLSIMACGCGATHEEATTHSRYRPADVYVLARERLPGDDWAKIVVKRYVYDGKSRSELAYSLEPTHPHELTEGGNGPSLESQGRDVVRLEFNYGCVGRTRYTLALGMLRDSAYSVIARDRDGTIMRFSRVAIPPKVEAKEVAVFAVLGGSGVVVARRENGGTAYSEPFGGQAMPVCAPGRRTGGR